MSPCSDVTVQNLPVKLRHSCNGVKSLKSASGTVSEVNTTGDEIKQLALFGAVPLTACLVLQGFLEQTQIIPGIDHPQL